MGTHTQNQNSPVGMYSRIDIESGETWLVDFKDRRPPNRSKLDNTQLNGVQVRVTGSVAGSVALGYTERTATVSSASGTAVTLESPPDPSLASGQCLVIEGSGGEIDASVATATGASLTLEDSVGSNVSGGTTVRITYASSNFSTASIGTSITVSGSAVKEHTITHPFAALRFTATGTGTIEIASAAVPAIRQVRGTT